MNFTLFYFQVPDGKVTYRRQCIKNDDHFNWSLSNKTFTKLHVSSEGEIESEDGMLQVWKISNIRNFQHNVINHDVI